MEKDSSFEARPKVRHDFSSWLKWVVLAALISIVILLIFLMRGKTTVTGQYLDDVKNVSLSCEGVGLPYPIFTYDNSSQKKAKLNLIFSRDELKSISLVYNLSYSSLNSSTASKAHNHAAMNISFGKDGLNADNYSAVYSESETGLQMSLYATGSDLKSSVFKKYFFLEGDTIANSPDTYQRAYESRGFTCKTN